MKKLVRDNIPEIIRKDNQNPIFYIADSEEYYNGLTKKLDEEIKEFQENNNIEELADILEVIYAILDYNSVTKEELENIRLKKASERGVFKERIILDMD